jgi:hypothetical protein
MSHLEIIKEAYDKCGINYFVKDDEEDADWQYLVYMSEGKYACSKQDYERMTRKEVIREARKFMEFYKGDIASY